MLVSVPDIRFGVLVASLQSPVNHQILLATGDW